MFREIFEKIRDGIKMEYKLVSGSYLDKKTHDVIDDLKDQFGDFIVSFDKSSARSNEPYFNIEYTKEGAKLEPKIAKELKTLGYIK